MDALAAALGAALDAGGIRWGDGQPPAGQPAEPEDTTWERYVVLWCPIRGGTVDGNLATTDTFDLRFQLNGWGRDTTEARIAVEEAHDVVMAARHDLDVDGRSVQHLRLITPGDGVFHDRDTTPALYAAPRVYGVRLIPTT